VTPKLTVNYGVRWEYYPFATTDHGGVKLFDPKTGNVLIGGNGTVPLDDGVEVGHGQLLPRAGVAYRLGMKTVIRAGYGLSADSNNWRFFRNNYPATTNSIFWQHRLFSRREPYWGDACSLSGSRGRHTFRSGA